MMQANLLAQSAPLAREAGHKEPTKALVPNAAACAGLMCYLSRYALVIGRQ